MGNINTKPASEKATHVAGFASIGRPADRKVSSDNKEKRLDFPTMTMAAFTTIVETMEFNRYYDFLD